MKEPLKMTRHKCSVTVDLRAIKSREKEFKSLTSLIRSGVISEHGFSALKGLTDSAFRTWVVVIRFRELKNRAEFYRVIQSLLHPKIFNKVSFTFTRPNKTRSEPIRYLRAS